MATYAERPNFTANDGQYCPAIPGLAPPKDGQAEEVKRLFQRYRKAHIDWEVKHPNCTPSPVLSLPGGTGGNLGQARYVPPAVSDIDYASLTTSINQRLIPNRPGWQKILGSWWLVEPVLPTPM